jgi:hypothetical protein
VNEVAQFADWFSERLNQQQHHVRRPLYHYTSSAGLLGIFEKGEIWFTSLYHLNDPSEQRFCHEIAFRLLNKAARSGDDLLRAFVDELQAALPAREYKIAFEPFVACFSKAADDLGQWRAYGDNGRGFAIGFRPEMFHVAPLAESHGHDQWINEVAYGVRTGSKLVGEPLRHGLRQIAKHGFSASNFNGWRGQFCLIIMWYSLGLKHRAYANEQEVRLLMQNREGRLNDSIEFRSRDSAIIPFIREPMKANAPTKRVALEG